MSKLLFSRREVQELLACSIKRHHGFDVDPSDILVRAIGEVVIPVPPGVSDADISSVLGGNPPSKPSPEPKTRYEDRLWTEFIVHTFADHFAGSRTRNRNRLYAMFKRAGCNRLDDVLMMSPKEMAVLPTMGEGTWLALRKYFGELGYCMPVSPAWARTTSDSSARKPIRATYTRHKVDAKKSGIRSTTLG